MRTFTHKLAFLLVTLLCCAGLHVKADELTVADGASSSNSNAPVYGLWTDNPQHTQIIYPADSLNAMSGGTITSMKFYMTSGSTKASWRTGGATFQIGLAETSQADLSSAWATEALTNVYNATVDASGTEMEIAFETPFDYNGENLVVDFLLPVRANDYESASFVSAPLANASRYCYGSGCAGTAQGYLPKVTFEYTVSSGGSVCDRVDEVAVVNVTANSAEVNWVGGNGTYLLEYKLASADKWTAVENLSGTNYALTNLTPNSAYQVRVYNVCGPENVSSARSASFSTLIALPYEEKFATSSIPTGWSKYSGALNADGSAALSPASGSYHWAFGSSSGVFDNHAYIEVYSSQNQWLLSPVIPMEAAHQLSFNLALTYWTGDNVPCTSRASQPDARFVVLASADDGQNWTILREWNNAGSDYVYDEITCSAEGEEVEIDLSAYDSQNIQIGFYIYHSTGGDNKLHIDNVKIAPLPTCLKPTGLHEVDGKATKSSVQVEWTAETGESAWKLKYKKAADADEAENWTEIDVTTNPYILTGLSTYTEYNVQVAANCGGGDISEYCKAITVKTAAGVPYAEGFSNPSLPSDWKRYSGNWEQVGEGEVELEPVSAGWAIAGTSSTKNGVFPDSTSHLYLKIAGENTKHWIVSPIIEMEAGYQLSFNMALTKSSGTAPVAPTAGQQNDDQFIVAINEGDGWESLRTWSAASSYLFDEISATASGQAVKLDLSSYAGKGIQIAFYGESSETNGDNNLHISALKIEEIPDCQPALSLAITGISGTSATAAWTADEAGTWQYGYKANPESSFVPSAADFTGETTNMSVDLDALSEVTDYVFFVRRKCGEDTFSEVLTTAFHTIQTPVVVDGAHSFSDGFEAGNKWLLINGEQTNQWAYGTATSSSGTSSLYISNDGGESNAMSATASAHTSYVYATKTFTFAESGVYTFSYDWKCNGSISYAYLRVYLAPVSAEPAAGSSPSTTGWIALHEATSLYGKTDWQQESFDYRIEDAGTYKIVLYWYNYYSSYSTYTGPAAVDNIAISRLACPKPEGLSIAEIGAESASFAWNDANDGSFEYAYASASAEIPEEFTPVAENTVEIEGLTEMTAYKFYLRKSCSETEKSAIVSVNFTTNQKPVAVGNSFAENFEGEIGWLFTNGAATNAWVIGTAAHNGEGSTKALYISNDEGATHAYSTGSSATVFATKAFDFADGDFVFKYNWIANGEVSSYGTYYDYMRVLLVPGSADLTAGTLPAGLTYNTQPAGWIALDGGVLQGKNTWQNYQSDEITISAGVYTVVLLWKDDTSGGDNPPAAIDNFSITKILCSTPLGLKAVADSTTATSAILTWTPKGSEENWLVRYRKAGAEAWNAPIAVAHVEGNAADSVKIEGLDPSSTYEAQVAAVCDPSDEEAISDYSASIRFNTECAAIAVLSENFDALPASTTGNYVLPNCWSRINTSSYAAAYPLVVAQSESNPDAKILYFLSRYGSSYDPKDQYVVLPELISLDGLRITFKARKEDTSDEDTYAVVGILTDPADAATFQYLDSIEINSISYATYSVPFAAYTGEGKYVAIVMPSVKSEDYATLLIDDVVIEEVPACLEPNGLAAALTQGNGSIATLSWSAGADETAWVVEYSVNADFSEAISENVSDTSLNLSGLTAETVYYARVKAACGEEGESPWSDVISFKPTNKYSLIVNENAATTSSYVPFAAYYADGGESHSQFIIPDSVLTALRWGTINELTFYAAQSDVDFDDDQFEVYIAVTEATTLSALTGWNSLTKVRNAAAVSVSGGQMVITLDNPFTYEGGNLLIGFKQTDGETWRSCEWIATSAVSGNSYYSYYDYGYTSDVSTYLPKMKIEYTPGEAPECVKPANLSAVEDAITANSAVLTWKSQGTETNWLVRYRRVGTDNWSEPVHVAHVEGNNADSVTIEGLNAATTYEAQVASWCDITDEEAISDYSASISFTTECDVISAFPWEENFNSLTAGIPACWDNAEGTTTTESYKWNSYESGHEGKGLRFNSYYNSNGQTNFLKTPALDISKASILSFWYKNPTGGDFSVFYTVDGGAQTALATGLVGVSDWMLKEINLPNECIGHQVVIIFKGTSNWGNGDAYIYLDDVMVEEESDCAKPTGSISVSNITSQGASFSWTNEEETAWKYAVALASEAEPAEDAFIAVTTNAVTIESGLVDNSDYVFYLRRDCGSSLSTSIKASFHTLQIAVVVGNGFADDFEDGNNWMFVNGANAWVLGEAAHNGEGTHALYISNDGGTTNAYTTSGACVSYATKRFEFAAGSYTFEYDWKADGESSYDFLRVALVPDSLALPISYSSIGASSLPAGWVALDSVSKMNLTTQWKHFASGELAIASGTYNVVFAWRNDNSSGSNPPAAIDNFSIAKVLCAKPLAVTIPAAHITASSVQISWTADPEQDAWQIAIDTLANFNPDTVSSLIDVTTNPYTIADLDENKRYYVYVRANCGDNLFSQWSARAQFVTAKSCQTPNGLALVSAGLNSAVISWNTFGQSEFNLRYKAAASAAWIAVPSAEQPYEIEGLEPSTSYQVQVQAACEDSIWSNTFSFKTAYGTPFEEKFATTSIPVDWNRYTGLLSNVQSDPTKLVSSTSGWNFGVRSGIFGGSHTYVNVYGTSCQNWLATPVITLTEDVQLTFDLALTDYNNADPIEDATAQQDDKFIVLISADGGATWTILREWNNTGSEYVYNEITNDAAGDQVAINLSEFTGQSVKIAFYCESTASGGDNDLHVGNVLIDKVPTCLKPSALKISDVYAHQAQLAWMAGAEGQDAWQIALDTIAGFNPDTLSSLIDVTENPYVLTGLLPQHTYYVYVRANCGEEDGVSRWTDRKSFTTTIACPAPTGLKATLTPGNGAIATLAWKENGLATDWRVEYSVNANLSDSIVVLATDTFVNLTGLTPETQYYARVAADCGELDGESLYSSIISFTPTDRYELTINDGTATNAYVPVYGYWADNYSLGQFIVPAAQLEEIQWDSINALTFYANTASHDFEDGRFEAYVAEVDETAFAAATLNDWNEMILVKAAASLSVADNQMVVTFDEPYQYEGGNLLIGIKQTVAGADKSFNWYGVSAPNASVGGYKSKTSGALSISRYSFLPKMTIEFIPGVEPACKKAKGLSVDEITFESATFSWEAQEGAEWQYAVLTALAGAPDETDFISVDSNLVVVEGLAAEVDYIFYLRNNCGEDGYSELASIPFTTTAYIAILPIDEDFDNARGWEFVNGDQTNGWIIGEDTYFSGENSLYISNDGASYAYSDDEIAVSFAIKPFIVNAKDSFAVSFKWKAEGESFGDEPVDYLRAAIAPATAELTAGSIPAGFSESTLPAGWIAIDGGNALFGEAEWQDQEAKIELNAGTYKVVFIWYNDEESSDGAPAAVDDLKIVVSDPGTGVWNIDAGEKPVKFIRDNKVFILVNGAIYDATGRKVETLR